MLVQLSCVSRNYKDERRENRRADITACLATNIRSLRRQGQVAEGEEEERKGRGAERKRSS